MPLVTINKNLLPVAGAKELDENYLFLLCFRVAKTFKMKKLTYLLLALKRSLLPFLRYIQMRQQSIFLFDLRVNVLVLYYPMALYKQRVTKAIG